MNEELDHALEKMTLEHLGNEYAKVIEEREALKAELVELRKVQAWISVDDRLPEDGQEILAWQTQEPHCIRTIFYAHNWPHFKTNQIKTKITHWMPEPPPPEETK